ncbi:MAG TPA: heme biosynthesis HemY N-terminal domain-containing protein [Alphaproteobacteria bacterium]|jgi:HemY protein
MRVLWLLIQVAVLAGVSLWMFSRPGTMDVHWLGYDIEASVGVAFLAFVIALVVVMALTRAVGALFSLPGRWKTIQMKKRRDRGFRALTLGLSAVAAGDSRLASYQAYKMRRFLPDEKGLPWLLEAQAARLRGSEPEARGYFEKLLHEKDTAFLGVRGLLHEAVETADLDRALTLARQAMDMHSDQVWIIRTVFDLETRKREWNAALMTLKKAERAKAWPLDQVKSDRIAILLQQGDELQRGGDRPEAIRKLREAHRLNPSFVPTALRLAQAYIDAQKQRAAVAVIEQAWKSNPHPDLVPVWEALAPANKPGDMTAHLRWFERLVALKPGDAESQIAAARAAIQDGLWGEAWQYLAMAEKIRPNARLYRLWAQMEEKTGHHESARRYWEKAADAAADKVWMCRETGCIYERWSPIAEPHGAFNTILWDQARAPHQFPAGQLVANGNDLVIEPVRAIASRG